MSYITDRLHFWIWVDETGRMDFKKICQKCRIYYQNELARQPCPDSEEFAGLTQVLKTAWALNVQEAMKVVAQIETK